MRRAPVTILIDSTSNPHGRELVRQGDTLMVLSGCCRSEIKSEVYIDRLKQHWAICSNCQTELEVNDRGWLSILPDVNNYKSDRPSSWAPWGEFWFGFKDFAMEVT